MAYYSLKQLSIVQYYTLYNNIAVHVHVLIQPPAVYWQKKDNYNFQKWNHCHYRQTTWSKHEDAPLLKRVYSIVQTKQTQNWRTTIKPIKWETNSWKKPLLYFPPTLCLIVCWSILKCKSKAGWKPKPKLLRSRELLLAIQSRSESWSCPGPGSCHQI